MLVKAVAASKDETVSERAIKRRIVDADAHIDPPYEMWSDYLPQHLRSLAPVIEEGDEHDWIVKVIERDFAGIPAEDVDDIVCRRAARLYGLDK
jgi:hypothetical protein